MVLGSQDSESRFSHLLQPIRDLTKNWEVDIANHLERYLDEIEHVAITFDGGASTMNFAEAALLIQGTACVYSKKVEYLYALVYQVLDLLSSKKKLQQASSVDADGNDKDAAFQRDKDGDEEFLTLDDIKEHKHINMKYDGIEGHVTTVVCIPRTPMSLLPVEEAEKGENPLLSRTGEVLASRNDFKMNSCCVHPSGTMLLDMSHLSLLESTFRAMLASTPHPNLPRPDLGDLDQRSSEVADQQQDEGLPPDLSVDDNDAGFEPMDDIPVEEGRDENKAEEPALRRSLRQKKTPMVLPKTVVDPWAPLDPHAPLGLSEKPFKVGRTFSLPDVLETDKKARKRKKNSGKEKKGLVPVQDFIAKAYYSHSSKFPTNPRKVPCFPEFEKLFWEEHKRRQAFSRKQKKALALQGLHDEVAERELEEQEDNDNYEPAGGGDDDDDDQVAFGIPDLQSEVNFGADDGFDMIATQGVQSSGVSDMPEVLSYEDLVKHHVEGFLASAQQYAQITELSKRVQEWEDKIKPTLLEEETHGSYDIHEYGSSVIDSFTKKTAKVPFRKIAEGKKPFQIARLFLATLQLANNGNVEIGSEGILDTAIDTMTVQLLSTKRHFEELQEYRAPSVDN